MTSANYIIRGGIEGRERLRLLARVLSPTTTALFDRLGILPGMRCLDMGCGRSDASRELARLVGAFGTVVGTDLDETKLTLAREEAIAQHIANVSFRHADLIDPDDDKIFDFVHARFLLSHLPDPGAALTRMFQLVRPGRIVAVEDVDFGGHFCYPDSAAFRQYLTPYTETTRRRGADPNIGPRLPTLLEGAGFEDIDLTVVQTVAEW